MLQPDGTWISYFLVIGIRYLVIAGIAFFVWYVLLRKRILFKKIQLRLPANKDYQREIFFSLCTMFLFAFVPWFFLGDAEIRKTTTFYKEINMVNCISGSPFR